MATERQSSNTGSRDQASQETTAGQQTKQGAEQARQKAGELAHEAKEQARSRASEQKKRATESLGSMAQALRQTSDNLREQEQGSVARYVEDAAGQVERFAGYLRDRSPDDLLYETERFARREPALFLGGAFALGLLGARFLKSSGSSAANDRYRSHERRYQRSTTPTQAAGATRSYEPGATTARTTEATTPTREAGVTQAESATANTTAKDRRKE